MFGKIVEAFATGIAAMCGVLVGELKRSTIELVDEVDKLKRGVPLSDEERKADPYLNPRRRSRDQRRKDRFCANYEAMGEFDDPLDLS